MLLRGFHWAPTDSQKAPKMASRDPEESLEGLREASKMRSRRRREEGEGRGGAGGGGSRRTRSEEEKEEKNAANKEEL
eukprot:793607-Pyramimonas_sp.AAC.1